VAAQQLAGKGFKKVINLSGGMKAWHGHEAYGQVDQGLQLFADLSSAEQVIFTAYSLEEGLKDFYLKMILRVSAATVTDLFKKLAHVEDIHKDRLFDEYARLTGSVDRKAFEAEVHGDTLEGGLTTEEYLQRFHPDLEKMEDVIGLAMSIEAQALDLYTRAADAAGDQQSQRLLKRIAAEEKIHLEQLGFLLDNNLEQKNG
jgi:rubrerythrin